MALGHGDQVQPTAVAAIARRHLPHEMLRIQRFEERTAALFVEGAVKGTAHSYIGEEAITSAVCANLGTSDYVGSYHRGHGHCVAKGASLCAR